MVSRRSALFDVLAHVAYAMTLVTREVRAANARASFDGQFNSKQRAFIDFVLAQYVIQGVNELDKSKLSPLLTLKYSTISDAITHLGPAQEITRVFTDLQKHLYPFVA